MSNNMYIAQEADKSYHNPVLYCIVRLQTGVALVLSLLQRYFVSFQHDY